MFDVLVQILPFFGVVALGYGAARHGVFNAEATAALTRFVFYFALSAMLFRFTSGISVGELFDPAFIMAYLLASLAVYGLALLVALLRRADLASAAVEAQCAVIGNTGFLGVPMLTLLLGEKAIGPVLQVLTVDLILFSSLIVILISISREGRLRLATLSVIGMGLVANPMIMAMVAGLGWSATGWELAAPVNAFLDLLGRAATPCALFAIGASLASKSAERVEVAAWLSAAKLVVHPAAVAFVAIDVFAIDPFDATVMVAAAALPVAGNVYILAAHYKVAPQRVSAAILISTSAAVLSLPAILAWLEGRL